MKRHRRTIRSTRFAAPVEVRAEDTKGGGKRMTFTIATERAALDGGVLLMSGADLRDYLRRPVVLFNHDPTEPIGTSTLTYDAKRKALVSTVTIAPDAALSDAAKRQLAFMEHAGFGSASIGFRVTDPVWSPSREDREAYGVPDGGWLGRKWTLLEWSVVNIPADGDAMMMNSAEGLAFCRAAGLAAIQRFNREAEMKAEDEEKPDAMTEETDEETKAAEDGEPDMGADDGAEESDEQDAMSMLAEKLDMVIENLAALSNAVAEMTQMMAGSKAADMAEGEGDEPKESNDDEEDAMSEEERQLAEALREGGRSWSKVEKALTGGSARS